MASESEEYALYIIYVCNNMLIIALVNVPDNMSIVYR